MDQLVMPGVRENPDFVELERTRGRLGWTLTAIMLVIYFGFIFLVAFAPGLMATPVFGIMTLGFPLGLFVILSAIALTGFYVVRANSAFDRLTARIAGARP
jgi:uncharacterized membrane protein (DUF485 family)